MNVVRFDPNRRRRTRGTAKRSPVRRRRRPLAVNRWMALGLAVVLVGGLVASKQFDPPAGVPSALASPRAGEMRVRFEMCGRVRHTCVVDGDTIWLDGQNLRMQGYDTPEPYTDICGGAAEVTLAHRASARLLGLLNGNAFSVETFGLDSTGERTLATILVGGRDVGDVLIEEGLARRWPDGDEFWC